MSSNSEHPKFRTLYVSNINYESTEVSLKSHFEKWGKIVHCTIKKDSNTGKSRGFGFVTFKRAHMVDDAQAARPHKIDGRVVISKRAFPREERWKPETLATVNKIYINGITDDFREEDLREYFSSYGKVVNVKIVTDKDTGKNKGFGFVEFDDYDTVDKIAMRPHECKGRELDVRKSISRTNQVNIKIKKEMESVSRSRRTLQPAEAFPVAGYSGGFGYGGGCWQDCYGNSYLTGPGGFGNLGYGNIYRNAQGGGTWDGNSTNYDRIPVPGNTDYPKRNQQHKEGGQGSGEYGRP